MYEHLQVTIYKWADCAMQVWDDKMGDTAHMWKYIWNILFKICVAISFISINKHNRYSQENECIFITKEDYRTKTHKKLNSGNPVLLNEIQIK